MVMRCALQGARFRRKSGEGSHPKRHSLISIDFRTRTVLSDPGAAPRLAGRGPDESAAPQTVRNPTRRLVPLGTISRDARLGAGRTRGRD